MNSDPDANGVATVAAFDVVFNRFLEADGSPAGPELPEWTADADTMLPLYRNMVLTRAFDAAALTLQRTGRLGTYASPLGQEAIGAGVASAMEDSDVLVPSYREFSAQIWRGTTMCELLQYWGGDERGSDYQGPREDFPVSVPVASQCCHAVGVGYAFRLRREARAVSCFLGDGATSKGDFYEALNAAGAWRLPVLFVVSNNQWAISVPLHKQTAAETLAQKAVAAGVEGRQVDGNDIVAVRKAALDALDKARRGGGPCLIEALTYRMADHTTADDARRYRDPAEVETRRAADPIRRLRSYLESADLWDEDRERQLAEECNSRVEDAITEYESISPASPRSMFDHLYAELPVALRPQRDELPGNDADG